MNNSIVLLNSKHVLFLHVFILTHSPRLTYYYYYLWTLKFANNLQSFATIIETLKCINNVRH